jgi:hypothetical protein
VALKLAGALMLMMRKTVEGFQRIGGGEIQAAAGAEETCTASLSAFIHQGGTGHRNRWKFSQKEWVPEGDCTPIFSAIQQNRE